MEIAFGIFFILLIVVIAVHTFEEAQEMTYREHVNCRSEKEAEEFIFAVGKENVSEVVKDGSWIVVYLKEGIELKEEDDGDAAM